MSVFCRHNRFTAECPICSKGTVLDQGAGGAPRRRSKPAGSRSAKAPRPSGFSGPHVSAGPYEDEEAVRYEVRLERVPGGLRLAEWAGSALRRRAPVLEAHDLTALAASAGTALGEKESALLAGAVATPPSGVPGDVTAGVSRGRSGDFKEELRVEPREDGRLRVARWVLRPGQGWQLQDAPPMLPAARFAEAIADAARRGLLHRTTPLSESGDAARLEM